MKRYSTSFKSKLDDEVWVNFSPVVVTENILTKEGKSLEVLLTEISSRQLQVKSNLVNILKYLSHNIKEDITWTELLYNINLYLRNMLSFAYINEKPFMNITNDKGAPRIRSASILKKKINDEWVEYYPIINANNVITKSNMTLTQKLNGMCHESAKIKQSIINALMLHGYVYDLHVPWNTLINTIKSLLGIPDNNQTERAYKRTRSSFSRAFDVTDSSFYYPSMDILKAWLDDDGVHVFLICEGNGGETHLVRTSIFNPDRIDYKKEIYERKSMWNTKRYLVDVERKCFYSVDTVSGIKIEKFSYDSHGCSFEESASFEKEAGVPYIFIKNGYLYLFAIDNYDMELNVIDGDDLSRANHITRRIEKDILELCFDETSTKTEPDLGGLTELFCFKKNGYVYNFVNGYVGYYEEVEPGHKVKKYIYFTLMIKINADDNDVVIYKVFNEHEDDEYIHYKPYEEEDIYFDKNNNIWVKFSMRKSWANRAYFTKISLNHGTVLYDEDGEYDSFEERCYEENEDFKNMIPLIFYNNSDMERIVVPSCYEEETYSKKITRVGITIWESYKRPSYITKTSINQGDVVKKVLALGEEVEISQLIRGKDGKISIVTANYTENHVKIGIVAKVEENEIVWHKKIRNQFISDRHHIGVHEKNGYIYIVEYRYDWGYLISKNRLINKELVEVFNESSPNNMRSYVFDDLSNIYGVSDKEIFKISASGEVVLKKNNDYYDHSNFEKQLRSLHYHNGNLYGAILSYDEIYLVNPQGESLKSYSLVNKTKNYDEFRNLLFDSEGNLFIVTKYCTVIKLDKNLNEVWAKNIYSDKQDMIKEKYYYSTPYMTSCLDLNNNLILACEDGLRLITPNGEIQVVYDFFSGAFYSHDYSLDEDVLRYQMGNDNTSLYNIETDINGNVYFIFHTSIYAYEVVKISLKEKKIYWKFTGEDSGYHDELKNLHLKNGGIGFFNGSYICSIDI